MRLPTGLRHFVLVWLSLSQQCIYQDPPEAIEYIIFLSLAPMPLLCLHRPWGSTFPWLRYCYLKRQWSESLLSVRSPYPWLLNTLYTRKIEILVAQGKTTNMITSVKKISQKLPFSRKQEDCGNFDKLCFIWPFQNKYSFQKNAIINLKWPSVTMQLS